MSLMRATIRYSVARFSTPALLDSIYDRHSPQIGINLRPTSQRSGFPTPVLAKAGTMPAHEGLGSDDSDRPQDRRKPSIQLNKEPPIATCETRTTSRLPPQHRQLMPERRVFRLKSALGLERRAEQRKKET